MNICFVGEFFISCRSIRDWKEQKECDCLISVIKEASKVSECCSEVCGVEQWRRSNKWKHRAVYYPCWPPRHWLQPGTPALLLCVVVETSVLGSVGEGGVVHRGAGYHKAGVYQTCTTDSWFNGFMVMKPLVLETNMTVIMELLV